MEPLQLLKHFRADRCWSAVSDSDFVQFLEQKPSHFHNMIGLALTDCPNYSWRAAWLIARTVEFNDFRVKPYRLKIIRSLQGKSSGHQRELLKLIVQSQLTQHQEGCLFDVCVSIWENQSKKAGTRYFAFQYIVKILQKHPELIAESNALFDESQLHSLSPGVQRTVRKRLDCLFNP